VSSKSQTPYDARLKTYTVVAKMHAESEPREYLIRTEAEIHKGHTFPLDDVIWIVGDVDAELVWCVPWLFDHTDPIAVELDAQQ